MKHSRFQLLMSCLMLVMGVALFATLVLGKTGLADSHEETWDSIVPDHAWYQTYNNNNIGDPRFGGITYDNTDVFKIYNSYDLAAISYMTNHDGRTFEGKTVLLMNDINLAGMRWMPIGAKKNNTPFKGTFDGSGFQISNMLPIDVNNMMGFIGKTGGNAVVKNLTLEGVIYVEPVPDGENLYCAGFVATASAGVTHTLTIDNCQNYVSFNTANVTEEMILTMAGITSSVGANVEISRCANFADIKGAGANEGMFAGIASNATSISECANYGNVTSEAGEGRDEAAGIVNKFTKGTIRNSYNLGDITIGSGKAGGIVSSLGNSSAVKVYNCMNAGSVIATHLTNHQSYVGGIVASFLYSAGGVDFYNNANYGTISAARATIVPAVVGGVFGEIKNLNAESIIELENLYSVAIAKKGSQSVGAVAGKITREGEPSLSLSYCFTEKGGVEALASYYTAAENCGVVQADDSVSWAGGVDEGNAGRTAKSLLDGNAVGNDWLRWYGLKWNEQNWPFVYVSGYRIWQSDFEGDWRETPLKTSDSFNVKLSMPREVEGFVFKGYSLAADSDEIVYRGGRTVSLFNGAELYEIWGEKPNTISYNLDPNNTKVDIFFVGAALKEFTASDVGYVFPKPVYLSPGWNFSHWLSVITTVTTEVVQEATEETEEITKEVTTVTREVITRITADMVGKDLVLEAVYTLTTYTLDLNLEGGAWGSPEPSFSFDVGLAYLSENNKTRLLPVPERFGYNFMGWCYDSNFESEPVLSINVIDEARLMDEVEETTLSLWAKWDPKRYTVSFDFNNGTGTVYNEEFIHDAPKPVPTNMEIEREGYIFAGWSRHTNWKFESHNEIEFPASQTTPYPATGDITFYAGWTPRLYTMVFFVHEQNFADTIVRNQDFESEIAFPTKEELGSILNKYMQNYLEHYIFIEWRVVNHVGSGYVITSSSFSDTTVPLNGKMVIARWKERSYVVSFETNGGKAVPSYDNPHGMMVAPPITEKEDCVVAGWYTDKDFTNQFNFTTTRMPTHNLKLYAKWEIDFTKLQTMYTEFTERTSESGFSKEFAKKPAEIQNLKDALAAAKFILDHKTSAELSEVTSVRKQLARAGLELGISYSDGTLIPPVRTVPEKPNKFANEYIYIGIGIALVTLAALVIIRKREKKAEITSKAAALSSIPPPVPPRPVISMPTHTPFPTYPSYSTPPRPPSPPSPYQAPATPPSTYQAPGQGTPSN